MAHSLEHRRARRGAVLPASRAALVVAALALLAPSTAPAGSLTITPRMLPCRDQDAIVAEIQGRVGEAMSRHPDLRLLLQASPDDRLTVRLEGERRFLQRAVPFRSADCPALASAVLLLMRDWLDRDWTPPALPPVAKPEEQPSASPTALPAPASTAAGLSLSALAGAFVSPGGQRLGPAASLGIAYRATPSLSLGLAAGYQGPVSHALDGGAITLDVARAEATVGIALWRAESSRLDAASGPAACLLRIQSSHYPVSLSARRLELAWTAALTYHLRLLENLSWASSLQVDLRTRSDVIRVVGGSDLAVLPVRVSLASGVAWHLP